MQVRRIKLPATKPEWLAIRRTGITGTDLAGITGVSTYSSPFSVYLDKLGQLPPKEETEAMALGTYFEDPIAKLWQKRNEGSKIRRVNAILQHKKHDIMLGNIDRLIVSPKEGILEIKNVGAYMGKNWGTDEEQDIPQGYYMQLMWYMAVTGIKYGRFGALVGGNKFIDRVVEYDKEFAEALIEVAHQFWNEHVLKEIPPAIDGSEYTEELINMMLKGASTSVAVQVPEAMHWIEQELETKKQIKDLETKQREAKNNIKAILDATGSEKGLCGKYEATLKYIETNKFDSKALKADNPELYNLYVKQSGYYRLSTKMNTTK